MINPEFLNSVDDTYTNNGKNIIDVPEIPYYDLEQYDIYNEKDYSKFIQDAERVVRMSYEYRALIRYLNTIEGMNKCTFLSNVSNEYSHHIRIELHHTPFTLYDIASIVIRKRMEIQDSLDIFDIAKEIMWLHYKGYVGLIPVCETVHEMIHNQYIFVPLHIIRGNFQAFIDMYGNYISDELMATYESSKDITDEYLANMQDPSNIINRQMNIFNQHYTYFNIKDNPNITQELSDIRKMVYDRINDIKNRKPKYLYQLITKPDGTPIR